MNTLPKYNEYLARKRDNDRNRCRGCKFFRPDYPRGVVHHAETHQTFASLVVYRNAYGQTMEPEDLRSAGLEQDEQGVWFTPRSAPAASHPGAL